MIIIYCVIKWQEFFVFFKFVKDLVYWDLIIKGDFVGDYEMVFGDGMRFCGIFKCEIYYCYGYVVFMLDQWLSYVGCNCGKIYFGVFWLVKCKVFIVVQKLVVKIKVIDEFKMVICFKIG